MSDVWDGLFSGDSDKAWDKNNYKGNEFGDSKHYNANDFNLGGGDSAYAEFLARQQSAIGDQYRGRGERAQGRQLNEDAHFSGLEDQARQEQMNATGLARSAAEGNAPSEAQHAMTQGLNRSAAAATGMAGGARGGAAMALAQGNAQANTAMMNQGAAADAGRLRAQEMAQARGLYGSLSGQGRQMDQSRLASANQMSQFNRQSNDYYDIQNQQLAMQREQEANRMRQAQQQGATQRQQLLGQSQMNTENNRAAVAQANTNAVAGRKNMIGGMLGSAGTVATNALK